MKIREGDVFYFRYKPEIEKKIAFPYECFDGQLVAKKYTDGSIYLQDTYWGLDYPSNRIFTPEEAKEQGTLEYRFNLNDVEKGIESDLNYYHDNDVFLFNHQHGRYSEVYVRKGAKRSKEKMLSVVNQKIKETKKKNEKLLQELIKLGELKGRIEMCDLDIHF